VIIHACRIVNKSVSLDGEELFHDASKSIDDFLLLAYEALKVDYPKFYKMDNLSKAGFLAAEMLFRKFDGRVHYRDEDISIVLANANGSLDTDLKYAASAKNIPSPALFVYTLPNIVAGEICIRHKIKGENAFFVSEALDPELLASYVSMIRPGQLCVAGWVDVMGEHHDVLLYLLDNSNAGLAHTTSALNELYKKDHGTING
jgi:hypothetical protein